MIKNKILLESTRQGLLKNVQDEISRPQGSREIQRTKVGNVLWDTLYVLAKTCQLRGNTSVSTLDPKNYRTSCDWGRFKAYFHQLS